jgi:hypothetical protein
LLGDLNERQLPGMLTTELNGDNDGVSRPTGFPPTSGPAGFGSGVA